MGSWSQGKVSRAPVSSSGPWGLKVDLKVAPKGGPLKLKGVPELEVTKRKKKKKDKDKAKLLEAMGTSKKNEEEKRRGLDKRTPAQAAFEKMQEKRVRRVGSLGMPRIADRGLPGWIQRPDPGRPGEGERSERTLIPGRRQCVSKRGRVHGGKAPRTRRFLGQSGPQRGETETQVCIPTLSLTCPVTLGQ